jgi:hypothetical protein
LSWRRFSGLILEPRRDADRSRLIDRGWSMSIARRGLLPKPVLVNELELAPVERMKDMRN